MRHLHPDDFQLTYIYIGSVYVRSFVINWFVNSIQVCYGLKFNLYSLVFSGACMCELGVGEPRRNLLRFTLVRLLSRRTLGSGRSRHHLWGLQSACLHSLIAKISFQFINNSENKSNYILKDE